MSLLANSSKSLPIYISGPDTLTRLETIVEVYEKELKDKAIRYVASYDETNPGAVAVFYSQISYSSAKLIKAYR
jgi:hypothetical protein